ncbi:unnamed protein product [Choristocarpus tenellus]
MYVPDTIHEGDMRNGRLFDKHYCLSFHTAVPTSYCHSPIHMSTCKLANSISRIVQQMYEQQNTSVGLTVSGPACVLPTLAEKRLQPSQHVDAAGGLLVPSSLQPPSSPSDRD